MEAYNCPRCGYESVFIDSFKKHLQRKKLCKPKIADVLLDDLKFQYFSQQLPYICPNCNRGFSVKYGLTKHLKVCKPRTIPISTTINNNITNIIANNTTNIIVNNNITIINPLGHENTSDITPDFMLNCIKNKLDGLHQYIIKKHFDPNHPENHNIKSDGDNFVILEVPMFSKSKDIQEKVLYNGNYWIRIKKVLALYDNIMPRIETSFKLFLRSLTDENLNQKYIEDFVKDIVLPLDWSMELDCEDDFDPPSDKNIQKLIYKHLENCIDQQIALK
jgi:hypothetical protein